MFEFSVDLITGVMVGIEFPPTDEIDDLEFGVVVDLLIFRLALFKWKTAE